MAAYESVSVSPETVNRVLLGPPSPLGPHTPPCAPALEEGVHEVWVFIRGTWGPFEHAAVSPHAGSHLLRTKQLLLLPPLLLLLLLLQLLLLLLLLLLLWLLLWLLLLLLFQWLLLL